MGVPPLHNVAHVTQIQICVTLHIITAYYSMIRNFRDYCKKTKQLSFNMDNNKTFCACFVGFTLSSLFPKQTYKGANKKKLEENPYRGPEDSHGCLV